MAIAPRTAATIEDARTASANEGEAVCDTGNGGGSTSDSGPPFELHVVLAPVVELDLDLDDAIASEDVAATIACAVDGLMEALLLPIFVDAQNVLDQPEVSFTRDLEPVTPPIDRHGAKRAPKKTRLKRSVAFKAIGTTLGGPTSRAPSHASSRAASRFGGSTRAPTIAMRSVVMASRLAQLSQATGNPFQVLPWQDRPSSREQTPDIGAQWGDGLHGASSLAGSTARHRVDVAEIQRRGDIERDISTREARRQLTQQIQRKGELPLKLRSLADPTVSFDAQEALAAAAARGGAVSRQGGSRLGTRSKTPAGLPLASLTTTSSRFSSETHEGGDPSVTYRSEDYRDVSSSVVLLGRGGEVLVGDNCYLVGRRLRVEIAQDSSKTAMVEPRISLTEPRIDSQAPTTPTEISPSPEQHTPPSVGKASLPAVSVTKSSPQVKLDSTETQVSPVFEGRLGSFETYPRLEMDPSKTPLAKGVKIKEEESSASSPTVSPKPRHRRSMDHATPPSRPHSTTEIEAAGGRDSSTSQSLPVSRQDAAPEKSAKVLGPERSPNALTRATNRPTHLHSLRTRTRTPAQERRPPASKQSRSRFNLAQLEETAAAEAMEHSNAVENTSMSVAMPRPKYMREFPIPPPGKIRLFKGAALMRNLEAGDAIPFGALPSIVKAKR